MADGHVPTDGHQYGQEGTRRYQGTYDGALIDAVDQQEPGTVVQDVIEVVDEERSDGEAEENVGYGDGDEADGNRALHAVHRLAHEDARQHDEVQDVPDDAQDADRHDDATVDDALDVSVDGAVVVVTGGDVTDGCRGNAVIQPKVADVFGGVQTAQLCGVTEEFPECFGLIIIIGTNHLVAFT